MITLDQIVIPTFGVAAVWISQDSRRSVARWGCICGLISQPFWFFAAWHAHQWGIFAASIFYACGWLRGIRNYWMFPRGFCLRCGAGVPPRIGEGRCGYCAPIATLLWPLRRWWRDRR